MTVTDEIAPETADPPAKSTIVRRSAAWLWERRFDCGVLGAYLAVALVLTAPLWRDARSRVVAVNRQDQVFFEYVLARAARAVTHLENPLFTSAMNTPHGVNLMANTSVLGLSVPLSPVTLLMGPSVAFVVMTALGLAGTGIAWYLVLSRHIVPCRLAAAAGAAFCAFGPGMIAQANGHPNLVAQFLVPLIVWRVATLPKSRRLIRDGVVLGLLITYQAFINEEILFLTALALAVCAVVFVLSRRSAALARWRPYLTGLAIAGGVATVLLAYPLWFQFFGPQHYRGIPEGVARTYGMDAASYVTFPPQSLWRSSEAAAALAVNATERNSFFGWPLVVLLVALLIWQWRSLAVRMAAAVALFFVAVSLGVEIEVNGDPTGVAGPWRLLVGAPLFDSVVPARFALGATAAVGVLIALGVDALARLGADARTGARALAVRTAATLVVIAALVPLTPHWINTRPERATPQFFASDAWREYLPAGRSILIGDTARLGDIDGMRWSAASGLDFAVARGYFLGPNPDSPGKVAMFGSPHTSTTYLLAIVASTGKVPSLTDAHRHAARTQLRELGVGLVAVPVGSISEPQLRRTLNDLLGREALLVADVYVWPIGP